MKFRGEIPRWKAWINNPALEVEKATHLQKVFYSRFRDSFLCGEYIDLQGNSAYAFVLLNDLVSHYNSGPNALGIQNYLAKLGDNYPITKAYINSALYHRMSEIGDRSGIDRLMERRYRDFRSRTAGIPSQAKTKIDSTPDKRSNSVDRTVTNRRSPMASPIPYNEKLSHDAPRTLAVDNSVIDVTGQSVPIPLDQHNNGLTRFPEGVPVWSHRYIYSANELDHATAKQKDFFFRFRDAFTTGVYYDLEGNSNYAFILLFRLVDSYKVGPDGEQVVKWLRKLGEYYPKTARYIDDSLHRQMLHIGDDEGIRRLNGQNRHHEDAFTRRYDYDAWRFGSKHKERLGLSSYEVAILNRFGYVSNNFLDIQHCCDQVIALFLETVRNLEPQFAITGITFETRLTEVADAIAKKQYRYRTGSSNYKYCIQYTTDHLYELVFKRCENAIRDLYGHKRKLNADVSFSEELRGFAEERIFRKADELIAARLPKVKAPNVETELELNKINTTRWKSALAQLSGRVNDGNVADFLEGVRKLGEANVHNPSRELIYFEASKFLSKYDKASSLEFYLYYLDCDLTSATFDHRKLNKTVQKSLFTSAGQLSEFERIVDKLIRTRDLTEALADLPAVYKPIRKKIVLNEGAIHAARNRHSETVDLLDQVLGDEVEERPDIDFSLLNGRSEVNVIHEATNQKEAFESRYAVKLSSLQEDLLEMFLKNSFSVPATELEYFARANNVFKNQVIDSVNESCFEALDDVLIEEEDDLFIINEAYFRSLLKE